MLLLLLLLAVKLARVLLLAVLMRRMMEVVEMLMVIERLERLSGMTVADEMLHGIVGEIVAPARGRVETHWRLHRRQTIRELAGGAGHAVQLAGWLLVIAPAALDLFHVLVIGAHVKLIDWHLAEGAPALRVARGNARRNRAVDSGVVAAVRLGSSIGCRVSGLAAGCGGRPLTAVLAPPWPILVVGICVNGKRAVERC